MRIKRRQSLRVPDRIAETRRGTDPAPGGLDALELPAGTATGRHKSASRLSPPSPKRDSDAFAAKTAAQRPQSRPVALCLGLWSVMSSGWSSLCADKCPPLARQVAVFEVRERQAQLLQSVTQRAVRSDGAGHPPAGSPRSLPVGSINWSVSQKHPQRAIRIFLTF